MPAGGNGLTEDEENFFDSLEKEFITPQPAERDETKEKPVAKEHFRSQSARGAAHPECWPPPNLFSLAGKVALVCGGNSGIGLVFADAMAGAGADVCIWGGSEEKNKAAKQMLTSRHASVRVLTNVVDVGDEAQVERSFDRCVGVLGRVDAVFANAAAAGGAVSPLTLPTAAWRQSLRTNLDGVFFVFRKAGSYLKERGEGGSMVATGSLAGEQEEANNLAYSVAKAGVGNLVKSFAKDLARYRVRVNLVIPGSVQSDLMQAHKDPRMEEPDLKRIPAERWGLPYELGGMAVYLASEASKYHTGDTIVIDGGHSKF
jgi:NAD(P)-dependent dehydrogenase (short-subunit alcohol dehydrogenase family)